MDISHATGNGATQCTYVHKVYCPEGAGEQQNSYGELMGVFGPKRSTRPKPTIVSVTPDSGSVFTTADTVKISAMLADDSNMLGVKWTWIEGLPDAYKEDGYTRCTNDVCTDGYGAWKAVDEVWDFINLKNPPAGHYTFKLEVMDAYGNSASQMLEFDVMQGDTPTTTAGDDTTGEPGTTAGPDTGEAPTSGGGEEEGGDTESPTEGGEASGTNATNATNATAGPMTDATAGLTDAGEGEDGCSCRSPSLPSASLALLGLLGLVRRRRQK
jgi:MYXO-CTERM domain-containing protein